jgi:hypothetical protein
MGASLVYLNEANKEVSHQEGKNFWCRFNASDMQGWRLNMVSRTSVFYSHAKRFAVLAQLT